MIDKKKKLAEAEEHYKKMYEKRFLSTKLYKTPKEKAKIEKDFKDALRAVQELEQDIFK